MPLTELLRMIGGEVDATQERAPNSADPSSRPETDFCELVWENGHVTSKARKGPPSINDNRSMIHKSQGGRDANGLKMSNFSTINSLFGDFPSVVPSSEMGMGQDADMVPWLSYPDPLNNDYPCEFLPELSGVTMNDISNDNHLAFRERKSGFHGDGQHNSEGLKDRGLSKVDSNTVRYSRGENSEVQGFAPSSQNNVPRSGVSDITRDNVASRDFNSPSLCALTSLRSQKQDAGQPSTSSSFTNFPYFSRPGVLAKTNYLTVNDSKRVESGEQRCIFSDSNPVDSTVVNLASACSRKEIGTHNPSVKAPVNENPESLPKKPTDEMHSAKRIGKEDAVVNDTQQNHALDTTMSKVGVNAERNMVPVVAASSVCSGNSVDRASNERDLKRKLHETTESEGPSEEVDDESVGAKKAAHARASSKRIRAAEVHNLSERRRRDRINEKMRSLQELIPNCNKVDKASMLDEAIEYLKTLQLQVQMYSMGAGLYMQPMMLPPGMQPIHGAQMPHFPPVGLGMSMGMGFGMNMPFQSPHYPVPGGGTSFHGMPSSSLQPYAHPGQGLQMSMQRSPVHPVLGPPPLNIPMGVNVLGVAKDSPPEMIPGIIPNMFVNQATNQATKEGIQPPASPLDRRP